MHYPVQNPDEWQTFGRLSLRDRARLFLRTRQARRRGARAAAGIRLEAIRRSGEPLAKDQIVLICVCRNAASYLPSLLTHYRKLGVARFAFVDDDSQDATREMLLAAPDVDLYKSNVGFREGGRGTLWRDLVIEKYGRNRWYLLVDSDEYLVFPGMENRSLTDFVRDLERHSRSRALAAMLDLYPSSPLSGIPPHEPPEAPPTTVAPLFDGDSYTAAAEKTGLMVRGGPRLRLFGADMQLSKFPLVYADRATSFAGGTNHAPLPFRRNFSPVHCILLHYRFPAGAVKQFEAIAERGTHWEGARLYKTILASGALREETDLRYPGSIFYASSEDLVRRGFMQDLRQAGPASS